MAWNDLTIAQRSQLMNLFRKNGVSSLSEMRRLYDLTSPSTHLVEDTGIPSKPVAPMYASGGKIPPQGAEDGTDVYGPPVPEALYAGPPVPYGFYDAPIDWERKKALQHYGESTFKANQVSRAGAMGPYQIMPANWEAYSKKLGLTGSAQDYNNSEAVRDRMMDELLNAKWVNKGFPSDSVRAAKAFMGYNWGSGKATGFLEDMKKQGVDIYHSMDWIDKIPNTETRNYVNYILRERDIPGGKTIKGFEVALPHRFDAFPEAKQFKSGGSKGRRETINNTLAKKVTELWYRKNVQPKIDELGIDEVRRRLYKNISPYSYVEPGKRIKSALNDKLPEFEQFQDRHDIQLFPADRDDIFATYLGIPKEERRWGNNSPSQVVDSQYKPTKTSDPNAQYKAITLNEPEKMLLMQRVTEGGRDLSDYSIDKGRSLGLFPNYRKLQDVDRAPLQIGDSAVSSVLDKYFGPHTISVGNDPTRGQYVSYYDKWDLAPFSGNGEDESVGLGTPIEFYDRVYYDDFYGVDSKPEPGVFYGGYLTPAQVFGYASGGKIHIKKKNRGKFTALKKRTGKSASWFKAHGTPAQKKMAVFELNARKWKHAYGGIRF